MAENRLYYHTVTELGPDFGPAPPPWSMLVMDAWGGPTRLLMWEPEQGRWVFNRPGIRHAMSRAEDDGFRPIPRPEAEELARTLGFDLPSPAELHRMLAEGQERENRRRWQASAIRMLGRPWVDLTPTFDNETPESNRILYIASYPDPTTERANGVIAVTPHREEFRAVAWAPALRRWIHAPQVETFLTDDGLDDLKELVDRETAERIAREVLGTEFPTDEEIHRICTEATGTPTPNMAG